MNTITYHLNGKPAHAAPGNTVSALLEQQRVDPLHVVVEINRNILTREQFDHTVISQDDAVEVLRFVGGG